MADDKQQEKSLEKAAEQKTATYKPDSDEARAASQDTVDRYKVEMDKRIADYEAGVERSSSSYGMLKQVPITIFEGDSTLVRHGVQPRDSGAAHRDIPSPVQETAGGSPGEVARPGQQSHEVKPGNVLQSNPDGSFVVKDDKRRIESTMDVKGNTYKYGYDETGKLNDVKLGDDHWKSTDGKHWTSDDGREFDGGFEVLPDGGCKLKTERGEITSHLNGRVERVANDKSVVVEDASGRVERTVDATGKTRSFTYDANSKLNGVTDEKGAKWSTNDGENWTATDGRTWKGTIAIERDGTYREVDENFNETIKRQNGTVTVKEADGRITDTLPDGTTIEVQKSVDREKLERLAERLHGDEGVGALGLTTSDWDREHNRQELHRRGELNERIDDLNESEREALKGIYHKKYGHTIDQDYAFLEGAEKENFNNRLKSTDPMEAKADKLRTAIDKSHEAYSWHSYSHTDRTNPNEEVRETLKSMSSEEIKEMDNYYRRVYGESLHDAIKSDTPKATREMCEIYLKGRDKRTPEDSQALLKMQEQEKIEVEGVPDSKLTAAEANEVFDKNFTRLDKDKDGFVSKDEIDRAMRNSDYKGKDAQLVAMLKTHREELEELSNDENLDEDDGVTRKDMEKLARIAEKENKTKDEEKLVDSVNDELRDSGEKLERSNRIGGKNLWGRNNNPTESIRPEAVRQSDVGDCYFMASVAGMANTPGGKEKIKNMIEDNGDGTYTVTFPGDPKHPVTVDEPTQAELGHGAAPTKDGVWVAVLEKAYAKHHDRHSDEDHTYKTDGISEGGYGKDSLALLSGEEIDHDDLSDTSKEKTHEKLTAAMKYGRPVVASTPHEFGEDWEIIPPMADGKTDGTGIPTTHQYTVTGYDPETKIVTLRNPWGGEGKDGTFTMTLDEFHKDFEDVDYAKRA